MSLLDLGSPTPQDPILVSEPVWLRPIRFSDYEAWTQLREKSQAHLTAWEPAWRPEDLTQSAFRRRVRVYSREMRRGGVLPFLVFRRGDNALLGGVTISNIRYGASRSAVIGYWIGAPFTRRGYARAAVKGVLRHVFEIMRLNRMEAACQPENEASRRLLEQSGFQYEGRARDYLKINDDWRDHLLFAITASDYRALSADA